MEECVNVYQKQREDLLALARRLAEVARDRSADDAVSDGRPPKRRRTQQSNGIDTTSDIPMRATRSQSRMALQSSQEIGERSVVENSEDEGSQYVEEDPSSQPEQPSSDPNDGLVACPMCRRRMKEEAVFTHLDQCEGQDQPPTQPEDPVLVKKQPASVAYSVPSPSKARQRLGALNYSLLTETALRKKLAEIGIPSYGPKQLMQRRHMEWMNLWNASCDSSNPQTKKELLRELDLWERTQGRQIGNAQGLSGVMAKDFDAEGWTRSNKDDFAELIKKAREKAQNSARNGSKAGDTEMEPLKEPRSLEINSSVDHSSTPNSIVDPTSPAKPKLEQQESRGSQVGGVTA
jgi:E3 ubiquitin-protein ligase RAD18